MAQQKYVGWRGGLFELGRFVREDSTFGAVFERELESVGAAEFGWMEGKGHHGLARNGFRLG